MTHGDDQGLVLPPRLAPVQVVIVPIFRNDDERSRVMPVAEEVQHRLAGLRVKMDARDEVTPGFKFNDWELRGVPLRIEIGPQDVTRGVITLARRHLPGRAGKTTLPVGDVLAAQVQAVLDEIQAAMLERARNFRDAHIFEPKTYAELVEIVQNGWAYAAWCGRAECEAKVKEETKATTRCIPLQQADAEDICIVCGEPAHEKVYFARAY
jgi:prolyl-tRNA synthetase